MSDEYRIIKKSFSKDDCVYIIQEKFLFWWVEASKRSPVYGYLWSMKKDSLEHAQETLESLKQQYEKPKTEIM